MLVGRRRAQEDLLAAAQHRLERQEAARMVRWEPVEGDMGPRSHWAPDPVAVHRMDPHWRWAGAHMGQCWQEVEVHTDWHSATAAGSMDLGLHSTAAAEERKRRQAAAVLRVAGR